MTVPMIKSIGDVPYPIDTHSDAFSPLLTAGAALGITGEATDSAAWLQRVSASDGPTTIHSIRGRTLVWNQLAARRFTDVKMSDGVSFDYTQEGVISISGTATENVSFALCPYIATVANHKYLALAQVEGATIDSIDGYAVSLSPSDVFSGGSMRMPAEGRIYTCTEARNNVNLIFSAQNGTAISGTLHSRPQLFDLTAMFGAGNEPSTVAEFEALFPEPYYEYDAGSLLPVNMTGVETTGFNQWDEEWRIGSYNTSGAFVTGYNFVANVNPIRVFPNTTYCCTAGIWRWEYDANGAYLGVSAQTSANGTFTTGASTHFICFRTSVQATTYKHDICINLSDPTRNGTYEPYWQQERTIPAGTLCGAGSVYDEQTATERITRVGEVDLGTLTWVYNTTSGVVPYFATTSLNGLAVPPANNTTMPALSCAKYLTHTASGYSAAGNIITMDVAGGATRIIIVDSTYTDAADFKAAMSGVMLHYALAEPTVTTYDPPLNLTYRTAAGGTERVMVPTGENSAPPTIVAAQGYTAESLRDAALSAIASVENGLASTNYAVGSYLVHGGQLCKVTTAIATGESITIGTNVTATTVMAEILSLVQ